jgi:hypothetical protein
MASSRAATQSAVQPDLLERLRDHRLDELGDDPADGQDDDEAQELGKEAEERVQAGLK